MSNGNFGFEQRHLVFRAVISLVRSRETIYCPLTPLERAMNHTITNTGDEMCQLSESGFTRLEDLQDRFPLNLRYSKAHNYLYTDE